MLYLVIFVYYISIKVVKVVKSIELILLELR